jgi:hypothetical protein
MRTEVKTSVSVLVSEVELKLSIICHGHGVGQQFNTRIFKLKSITVRSSQLTELEIYKVPKIPDHGDQHS